MATRLYLRDIVATQAGRPAGSAATDTDLGHAGIERLICRRMSAAVPGGPRQTIQWTDPGGAHLDLAGLWMSPPLADQALEISDACTIAFALGHDLAWVPAVGAATWRDYPGPLPSPQVYWADQSAGGATWREAYGWNLPFDIATAPWVEVVVSEEFVGDINAAGFAYLWRPGVGEVASLVGQAGVLIGGGIAVALPSQGTTLRIWFHSDHSEVPYDEDVSRFARVYVDGVYVTTFEQLDNAYHDVDLAPGAHTVRIYDASINNISQLGIRIAAFQATSNAPALVAADSLTWRELTAAVTAELEVYLRDRIVCELWVQSGDAGATIVAYDGTTVYSDGDVVGGGSPASYFGYSSDLILAEDLMAIAAGNILVGARDVKVDDVNVGALVEDVILEYEEDTVIHTPDQRLGPRRVDVVGRRMKIRLVMLEASLANLQIALGLPASALHTDAGITYLDVGDQTSRIEHSLRMIGVAPGTDKTLTITVHKAVIVEAKGHTYSKGAPTTYACTFLVLGDDTQAAGKEYMIFDAAPGAFTFD